MPASRQSAAAMTRGEVAAYCALQSVLLFVPALICFFRDIVDDPDVWWHLKTGEWIFQHRAWPTIDTFSSHGAGNPWAAYSWIAELLLYGLHQALGLRGLVLYTAGLSVAIVAAFHGLLRRMGKNHLLVVVVTLVAALGLIRIATPRPWLFSILLFVIELDLLLTAGRTGNRRLLLWLIPLFVLWANVHIQFVLGLLILGAGVAEPLLARAAGRRPQADHQSSFTLHPSSFILADADSHRISFGWMLSIFVFSAAATLANPYHYHLYEVAVQLVGQSGLWDLIQELSAMRFRTIDNWAVLGVTVAAAFALGWRRQARLLLVLMFAMALYFSFRSQRDAWFVLFVGLALLAYVSPKAAVPRPATPVWANWAIAGMVTLLVIGGTLLLSQSELEKTVAEEYPARAVQFIVQEHCSGPMFNPFSWGGYLIFHLPQVPVGIDGRTMVHGEERILRHADTLRGKEGWQDDPELSRAGLVVLPRSAALASLLRLNDRFRLLHEDSFAVVFSANKSHRTQEKPR